MVSGLFNERATRLLYLGSMVRVDQHQFAGLHRLLGRCGRTLDVAELPEMFVTNNPITNAMTIGMDKPIIVLNSALLDLLDEDGDALRRRHTSSATRRAATPSTGPCSSGCSTWPGCSPPSRAARSATGAIVAALFEWQRKSELSADRAGLLATQDPATAFRVHMKFASGSGDLSELDQTSFFAQGQEYLDAGDLRDSVLKLLLVERTTHPFAVVRAAELRRWVDAGDYTRILSGDYPRREDDDTATVTDAARDAADSYTETFRQSQDAVGKLVHDVAGFFGSAKLWIDEQLRRNRD